MEREFIDWTAVGDDTTPAPRRRRRLGRVSNKALFGGSVVMLALTGATVVQATTGLPLKEGVRNGTATKETQIISKVTGNQYGTRQSNVSTGPTAGGSAIYGCRRPTLECTRAANLDKGPAASFQTKGLVPFTISPTATGVVPNLNADKVDGLSADEIAKQALTGKAATAGTADRAITADAVSGRTVLGKMKFSSPTATNTDEATARDQATAIDLGSFGVFKVTAKCFVDSDAGPGATPRVLGEIYVSSTQNGSVLDGQEDGLFGDPDFLGPATTEANRQVDVVSSDSGNVVEYDGDDDWSQVVAPDGSTFEFRAPLMAKTGTLAGGDGPYGAGDRCGFALSING